MDDMVNKFKYLLELNDCASWEMVSNDNGIMIERTYINGYNIACFKSNGVVNGKPEEIFNYVKYIYSNSERIKKYDEDIIYYKVIKKFNKDPFILGKNTAVRPLSLHYQVNELPWPLWNRDALYLQCSGTDGSALWLYMYSVDTDDVPKDDNKVRIIINISAYSFLPENGRCRVSRIVHLDPGGWIPVPIINNYVDKMTTIIEQLRERFE